MRATSDSPTMFLAPQPADADHDTEKDREDELTDAPSEFAATLGLVTSNVIIPPYTPTEDATASVTEVSSAPQSFETLPRPAAFDISSFELVSPDTPVTLPLEAALQQLTATIEQPSVAQGTLAPSTVAPESAPERIITAAHEVVEVVSRHVARGEQHITMVLRPAELGEVKVRVEHVRADHVRITIEAEKPESTQLLRERVPELQAALQQQGVTVRSIDVSLQASDDMGQRGAGGDAPAHHQHAEREEPTSSAETQRPSKRTKRNPKDLDVLV